MENMKKQSHWWWLDNRSGGRQSPWLQSTLSVLNEKTKAMLELIEEDENSFTKCAETYCKKRPELINMVEDFYRAHHSLAEQYDQVRHVPRSWRITTPSFLSRCPSEKSIHSDLHSDCYPEIYDLEESAESEVDDPEQDPETQVSDAEVGDKEVAHRVENKELKKLREEVQRLREEHNVQKEQLVQKDEEKREVIRQLSQFMELLKEDNLDLRKRIAKSTKKQCSLEYDNLKWGFFKKLFNGVLKDLGSCSGMLSNQSLPPV